MFDRDNFSQTDIFFKPTRGDLSFVHIVVTNFFPLWQVAEVFQLDRNEINSSNYQLVLESPAGERKEVLVREFKVLKDIQQIRFYLEFLVKLYERRVRVSRIYPATDGALVAEYRGQAYAVFEFLDATHFVPTAEAFAGVAREVARMHQVFSELGEYQSRIEEYSQQGETFFNAVPFVLASDISVIKNALEQKKEHTDIDALVFARLPQYMEAALQIEAMRKTADTFPKQIFHSDLHPHNILLHKGAVSVAALVDFDSVRVQSLGYAHDVAYAIYRLGRQFFAGKDVSTKEMREQANALRELFIAEYTQVRPLSRDELELLVLLVKEEMLKKLIYILKGAYLGAHVAWLHDLQKFIPALDEIDILLVSSGTGVELQ